MDVLAQHGDRRYFSHTLKDPGAFDSTLALGPFPCLLWDHVGGSAAHTKIDLARVLIRAGCRYAVCAGKECADWHDAFDSAYLTDHRDESAEQQDASFVMTTWHNDETADDVAFFFVWNTDFEGNEFRDYLVLHLGAEVRAESVEQAVLKYASERAAA
jgi:hypothetical protein